MRYAGYPENQDSNIEWMGRIPTHWSVHRLKWSVLDCTNGVWGEEADGVDDIVCLRVADFDRDKFTITADNLTIRAVEPKQFESRKLKKGDLLIEKSGGGEKQLVGCVVYFDHDFDAVSSNFVARMTVDPALSARYICYLHAGLYAGKLNYPAIKQTTGIQNLDTNEYLNTLVAYPPTDEQEQIAAFLDWKTGQIDVLIAKKKELLEKLKEKRLTVITQAVTKGLPSAGSGQAAAPLRDSGIPWLGQVPKHWEVKRLRFLLCERFANGLFKKAEFWGDGTRIVNVTDLYIHNDLVDEARLGRLECNADELQAYAANHGDFFVVRSSLKLEGIGKSAALLNPTEPTVFECHIVRGRPNLDEVHPRFLNLFMNSTYARQYFMTRSNVVTMATIDQERIKNLVVALPGYDEQQRISEYLDKKTARIDSMVAAVESAIARLTEYRTALITAATTGKIDVRHVAIPSLA